MQVQPGDTVYLNAAFPDMLGHGRLNIISLKEDGYDSTKGAEVVEVGDDFVVVKFAAGEEGQRRIGEKDILKVIKKTV